MASIGSVRLNLRTINSIMSSQAAQRVVDDEGRDMARRAGDDFEYVASPHKWTARGFVQPANFEGAKQEARDKRLTRSI